MLRMKRVYATKWLEYYNFFFKNIYVAYDGQNGLELFANHRIDIVITDIKMPNLNGLDMIEKIRKENPLIPIIITTAFNDEKYFIRSIDLKVDKYLLKPIEIENAKDVFYSISKMIDDRKKAKEFEIKLMHDKINRISKHIVSQIADSYQSPCIVYTEGEIRYLNDAFCSLFDAEELEEFLKNEILFDERDGFMVSLNDYDDVDPTKNRVSISKHNGRKVYRVKRNAIELDDNDVQSTIYLFNDITLEEYQKIKIKSYLDMLEEMVFKTYYKANKTPIKVHPEPEKKSVVEDIVTLQEKVIPEEEVISDGPKLSIGAQENALLRRSHVHKTTAKVYIAELDDDTLKELQELDELDKDFKESIILLEEDANIEGIRQMSAQLERYAHEISLLFEFEDLAYAVRSLATLLMTVDESKLEEKILKKVVLFLGGIQSDLADWRHLLFVEQSALDIHYLDSSLFSACLQIELVFSEDVSEMESEEDDLILF